MESDDVDLTADTAMAPTPAESLAAASEARAALAAHAAQPWWRWIVMGCFLGSVFAIQGIPESWHALGLTVAILSCVGLIATAISMQRSAVTARVWGGVGWLSVLIIVAAVVGFVGLSAVESSSGHGWQPQLVIYGAVVAVVYAGGAILADRLRVRHARRADR